AAYDKLNPGKYSLKKIESLIQSFLLPKRLLLDFNAPDFLPELSSKRAAYIYAKVRLLPRQIVYPVAKLFGWAFQKWALILWLTLFVVGHLIFYLWILPEHPMRLHHFTGS